jgi:oxygen-independent coproporphyrinogen-3 oxidase
MTNLIVPFIRRSLAGSDSKFTFSQIDEAPEVTLSSAHIYIHIPFCRNKCPYCPYYKVQYSPQETKSYAATLIKEIDIVNSKYGRLTVPSIYIGGGTPALLGQELPSVINHARTRLDSCGDVAIELRPEDCTKEGLKLLKDSGVSQASVGVQTFQPNLLGCIGRDYTEKTLSEALDNLNQEGFSGVNADMMFALPGQSMIQLEDDARRIVASGVDQVTCYPLFTFPYTSAGKHLDAQKLKMPPLRERRRQYKFLWEFYVSQGYRPVSVWSFLKGDAPRFSSVTRDVFIGLGAGAATHVPGHFWFNPFDVQSYTSDVDKGVLPSSLHMPVSNRLADLYWLYWRLYETYVPNEELRLHFPRTISATKTMLFLSRLIGWSKRENNGLQLTRKGAFWIHLAQNYFLLESIDRLWREAIGTPYPKEVKI